MIACRGFRPTMRPLLPAVGQHDCWHTHDPVPRCCDRISPTSIAIMHEVRFVKRCSGPVPARSFDDLRFREPLPPVDHGA